MANLASPADTLVATLGSGVRVAVVPLRHVATAAVSVFVRSGSQHESARMNGISHFIEHMAFKGTRSRDCQQINLDAERLGAEVNAHTDQGHTAFHMRGLARDAGAFVAMLGDIVLHGTFPEHEIERERQVILHEYTEDEDDPMSTAFKLFDVACYGDHPLARPVIGNRANVRRFTRAELCPGCSSNTPASTSSSAWQAMSTPTVSLRRPIESSATCLEAARTLSRHRRISAEAACAGWPGVARPTPYSASRSRAFSTTTRAVSSPPRSSAKA